MKKLNLGCGNDYKQGWINSDIDKKFKPDRIIDLNKSPYSFKSNEFDEVYMKNVLEHVDNPIKTLQEIVRICKQGAKLTLILPHARSYSMITDIQHKNFFTENSFGRELMEFEGLKELVQTKMEFRFDYWWKRLIPFKRYLKIFLNGIYDGMTFEFIIKK